ncbi:MAG: DUF790 family protein [Candidatus Asgardarchaeia archaeon]
MSVRLSDISYKTFRDKIYVRFLEEKDVPVVDRILKKIKSLDNLEDIPEEFYKFFDDFRITRGILKVVLKFAKVRERFEEILGEDLKGLKESGLGDPIKLKLYFFKYVNKEFGGFVEEKDREEAIDGFSSAVNIEKEKVRKLIDYFLLDDLSIKKVSFELEPYKVVGMYNLKVLESLIMNSREVEMELFGQSLGTVAKRIVYVSKKYGILCDLFKDNGLKVRFYGPLSIFGRPNRFGKLICSALLDVIRTCNVIGCNVGLLSSTITIRGRDYKLHLRKLPPLTFHHTMKAISIFDSEVEKRLYWAFKSTKLGGWSIEREPDPIIIDGRLIVPDFLMYKGGKKVLVEIVGYWREEYLKKKIEQMERIKREGIKILIVANRKYSKILEKIGVPVISYYRDSSGLHIPIGKVMKFLKSFERGDESTG